MSFLRNLTLAAIGTCFMSLSYAHGTDSTLSLANRYVSAEWRISEGTIHPVSMEDLSTHHRLMLGGLDFSVRLTGGEVVDSSHMRIVGNSRIENLAREPGAGTASEREGGRRLSVELSDPAGRFSARLVCVLRTGSRYLREEVSIKALKEDLPVDRLTLIDLAGSFKAIGRTQGSPLASDAVYAGVEDPLSRSKVSDGDASAWVDRKLPIRAGQTATLSAVIGFYDPGQLRRQFLAYLERERAHPYRTFLHYNSWYDIGYFTPYNEKDCVDAIHAFSNELARKRGVKISSFLFDDGWDDTGAVWEFHKGFPNGFLPVKKAAEEIHADPGIWLSPWGGYGNPRERRLATGKAEGFEIDDEGYALSGPRYYKRFHDVTLDLVQKYGINQFKFDGTGSPDKQYPGSAFGSDFEAAIKLIQDLRQAKPGLFINLTTGTWPSPFWTRYADSIWRGGSDHSFAGVGTDRQRWITYRDGDTYRGVVQRGPLYPLNSLMLHGMIYARHANKLNTDPHDDFRSEVRDYFSTGTQLQEMYITPSLLTQKNWDDLAEAAKWSRDHADVLVDTHWVGGNPLNLNVYGWASWTSKRAILSLRNPSDKPQEFSIDVDKLFELPKNAPGRYRLHSPWAEDRAEAELHVRAGTPVVVTLKPFEVRVWNAMPE
ncbi:MAG: enterotoxin [Fimbriimonas sp.]|nr:enterotoxin [Fimbriimonas sp.]